MHTLQENSTFILTKLPYHIPNIRSPHSIGYSIYDRHINGGGLASAVFKPDWISPPFFNERRHSRIVRCWIGLKLDTIKAAWKRSLHETKPSCTGDNFSPAIFHFRRRPTPLLPPPTASRLIFTLTFRRHNKRGKAGWQLHAKNTASTCSV